MIGAPPKARADAMSTETEEHEPRAAEALAIAPERKLPEPEEQARGGFWSKLRRGLSMTHTEILDRIGAALAGRDTVDAATLEFLEEALIAADIGGETALELVERIQRDVKPGQAADLVKLRAMLVDEMAVLLLDAPRPPAEPAAGAGPLVTLVVGVNGAGKTTSIAKLARRAQAAGRTPLLAAGDTFRAAAIEQLKIWADRAGVPVIAGPEGSDSSAIVYDGVKKATAEGIDVLIVDTAGRLQNKKGLMDELAKIRRVLGRLNPEAPHDVVLVLDATNGQNALSQIDVFKEVAGVTGLIMTKLDGTARGGILVAIAERFALPVHAIGVGERTEDLQPFDAGAFARAIAGLEA
jgi:fused signal recognition particle receptor